MNKAKAGGRGWVGVRWRLAVAGLAWWVGGGVAPAADYTGGHGDIGIGYEGGELELHVHLHEASVVDGTPLDADGEYGPDELTIVVPYSTYEHVVDVGGRDPSAAYDPIGVNAGEGYWFLPATDSGPGGADALGTPFLGLGAEELEPLDWVGQLTLSLVSVSGPGYFSMWVGGFAPTFFMSNVDGISGADQFLLDAGGHEHVNFSFSQAGTYQITLSASGTHAIDGAVSDTATYTFEVQGQGDPSQVPEPSTVGLLLMSGLLLARTRRRPARGS